MAHIQEPNSKLWHPESTHEKVDSEKMFVLNIEQLEVLFTNLINGVLKVGKAESADKIGDKDISEFASNSHTHNALEVGADAVGSASSALAEAKEYADMVAANLINGAPNTLDTLGEVARAMQDNQSVVEALENAIGDKLSKTGDSVNVTTTFTQASSRANITSGEKHSVIFGKVAKFFADLKTVAFSGSYNDLSNKPTSMTPSAHNQAASTITAGTLGGRVQANATATATLGNAQVRDIYMGTTEMTAGTTALATGSVYIMYE